MSDYDYAIVGAGSAGSVVAHRLIMTNPALKVLLLEAGGEDIQPAIFVPAALPSLFGTEVDWAYMTEPEAALGDRSIYHPRGKVLGGSSSINGMIYIRGNRQDFDRWEAAGNAGWGYESVLPYFRKAERNGRGADHYHGADGPLVVCDNPDLDPRARTFLDAASELGFAANPDFNGVEQDGFGRFQVNIEAGRRVSSAEAYLRPVVNQQNLTIATNARATRILLTNNRVTGLKYLQDGVETEIGIRQELVLSAGTFESPKLLMLSGIGPADHLRKFGIPVVLNHPGVGANLQDHPRMDVAYANPAPLDVKPSSNILETAGFINTSSDPDGADVQFHFATTLVNPALLDRGPGWEIIVCATRPRSRGVVRLRSADPRDNARVCFNYLMEAEDRATVLRGVSVARELAMTASFADIRGEEISPGIDIRGAVGLEDALRRTMDSEYHPVGTCKMGSDNLAVVDAQLRVHGIDGLRVADASVFPDITSGNTNAAAVMIGEKASDFLLDVGC